MWIYTGNKLAKFHGNVGNILCLSENIAKKFFFGGGLLFLTHTVLSLMITLTPSSPGRSSAAVDSGGRHIVDLASLTLLGNSPSMHYSQGSVSPHQSLEDTW